MGLRYIMKVIENDPNINHKTSKSSTRNRDTTSEFEAYVFAIKDQEISTKHMKAKRQIRNASNTILNARCRICKAANKDIIHIIVSCPMMAARYYLPICNGVPAKTVFNSPISKQNPSHRRTDLESPEYIHKETNLE